MNSRKCLEGSQNYVFSHRPPFSNRIIENLLNPSVTRQVNIFETIYRSLSLLRWTSFIPFHSFYLLGSPYLLFQLFPSEGSSFFFRFFKTALIPLIRPSSLFFSYFFLPLVSVFLFWNGQVGFLLLLLILFLDTPWILSTRLDENETTTGMGWKFRLPGWRRAGST